MRLHAIRPTLVLLATLAAASAEFAGAQDLPKLSKEADNPEPTKIEVQIPKGLVTPEKLRFDKPYQDGLRCGPNALYAILRMHSINVGYEDVVRSISIDGRGSNLEDIRRAAERYGLEAEVRKVSPEDLVKLKPPLLVHVNSEDGKSDAIDHFLVVSTIDSTGAAHGLDTTNGVPTDWPKGFFARNFSGYVLISRAPFRISNVNKMLLVTLVIFSTMLISSYYRAGVALAEGSNAHALAK